LRRLLSLSPLLPLHAVHLFLLGDTSLVIVDVECICKEYWISTLACTLRVKLFLVPFYRGKDLFSEFTVVRFCQTLGKLGGLDFACL